MSTPEIGSLTPQALEQALISWDSPPTGLPRCSPGFTRSGPSALQR